MKFNPEVGKCYATINGVKIFVPHGVKYITINMNDVVFGWSEKPFISEGYWDCLVCPGYRLGTVDWDDENDNGKYKVYEVQY